jgi:multidrug efflux system membrane fusion protein
VAPIAGRAGSILIDPGNLVKASDSKPLMVIHQVKPIYVRFSVAEQYLSEIGKQMGVQELNVQVSIPGKAEPGKQGQLTFMDNTVDPATGTIGLKASLANQDNGLWPGQFVNVVLVLGMRPHAVVVPSQAVQMGQQGHFIFVVGQDLSVESRDVQPGVQIDGLTVIEKGLAPGEEVVRDGQLRLFPGAKVILKNDRPAGGDARP